MTVVNPVAAQPKSQRYVSYLQWKITTWIASAVLSVALAALVADVVIYALSFASPHVVLPDWVFAPFFAFAIACTGFAVLSWSWSHGWPRTGVPITLKHFRGTPRHLVQLSFALAIVAVVVGIISLSTGVSGQPGYNAATHQYYFDDHGSIIVTTRAHYLSEVALQTRGFISFAMLFTLAAVSVLEGERRTRKSAIVARMADVPLPTAEQPRRIFKVVPSVSLIVFALTLTIVGFVGIVGRVDAYLANPRSVTVVGITQYLSAGPKVVFIFCETTAIHATYGCPTVTPHDITIKSDSGGATLITTFDPSSDHVSPRGLPAVGQLVSNVKHKGIYRIRLLKLLAKDVFVADSPGTVAHRAAGSIVMAAVGLAGTVAALILLVRRTKRRYSGAPAVEMPGAAPPDE